MQLTFGIIEPHGEQKTDHDPQKTGHDPQKTDNSRQKTEHGPPASQNRLRQILDLAHELLRKHQLEDWRIKFDHARRRAGLCNFTNKTISLSRHYAREAPMEHITDTILHEIAHALVGPHHGHDAVWRRKARQIGCTAMRCHNLNFSTARWVMTCPNGCFSVERHRRSSGFVCKKCKKSVVFVPAGRQ